MGALPLAAAAGAAAAGGGGGGGAPPVELPSALDLQATKRAVEAPVSQAIAGIRKMGQGEHLIASFAPSKQYPEAISKARLDARHCGLAPGLAAAVAAAA